MSTAKHDELLELLFELDIQYNYQGHDGSDYENLIGQLDQYLESRQHDRAVLGLDIYQYSGYETRRQRLIPTLFRHLYQYSCEAVADNEPLFFGHDELKDSFIQAGDGGFQILPTPLHAVLLCAWFQLGLDYYNAGFVFPRLRRFLGPLTLRYALTFDSVIPFDDNFYGSAIVNNARILSRDSLNRFLLDARSVSWFIERIAGIENLCLLRDEDLKRIPELCDDKGALRQPSNAFRDRSERELRSGASGFKLVVLQKVGAVMAKRTSLDVYNCYFQVVAETTRDDEAYRRRTTITVGNLNAAGIAER